MAGLEDLGRLWQAKERARGLALIAKNRVLEGVELLERLGGGGLADLDPGERPMVGEAFLVAGKCAQAKGELAKALERLRKGAALLPPRTLLQERIRMLQAFAGLPAMDPLDERVRAELGLSPGRVLGYEGLSAVDQIHALGRYVVYSGNTPLTERIRDMKQRGYPELARHFAGLLAGYVARQPVLYGRVDLVVPVPPDPEKFAQRGNGPTDLMLDPLCGCLALPSRPTVLARALGDEPTREASPDQILASISLRGVGAWIAEAREVLLLEDVVVHGKNINACAIRLKEAGVQRVIVLALASTTG